MVTEQERKQSVELLNRAEELRRGIGISKAELYEQTGLSSSAVSQWRAGLTKPALKSVMALADALNTTTEFLLYGNRRKPAANGELSPKQRELIDLIQTLEPTDISVLLAAARELSAARQYQGTQE